MLLDISMQIDDQNEKKIYCFTVYQKEAIMKTKCITFEIKKNLNSHKFKKK